MAERIVSPGVFTREKDLSFLPQGITEIGAALIGPTQEGPAFVPTIVRNMGEFEDMFGKESQDFYVPFTAKQYLQSAGTVTIVRVLGLGGYSSDYLALGVSSSAGHFIAAVLKPSRGNSAEAPNASTAGFLSGPASASLGAASDWEEATLTIAQSSNAATAYTISLDTGSANFIGNVFSSDPQETKQKVYLAVDNKGLYSNSGYNANVSMSIASGSDSFLSDHSPAQTPSIQSQLVGGTRTDLFKVYTRSDGNAANAKFKVGIRDIREAKDVAGSDYGTFTLDVQINNPGQNDDGVVLETFQNLTFDEDSVNFLPRAIGDRYVTIETTGKLTNNGDYPNQSKYVYIRDYDNLTGISEALVPMGFGALTTPSDNQIELAGPNTLTENTADAPVASYVSSQLNSRAAFDSNVYYGFDFANETNKQYLRKTPASATTGNNVTMSLEDQDGHVDASSLGTPSSGAGVKITLALSHLKQRKFVVPFQGGFDGMNPAAPKKTGTDIVAGNSQGFDMALSTSSGSVAYKKAINAVSNPDEFDINLLALPGVIHEKHPIVTNHAIDKVEDRADCFFILDGSTYGRSIDNAINDVKALDSNYVGTYYPWVKILDGVKNKPTWVPPSVVLPGVYANNDAVGQEWFAPAGLNRGGLTEVLEAQTRLTNLERDDLYENRINPIATFPGQGVVVFGQKTLQAKPSALDRINVRRLLINLRKFIASSSRFLVFEQNTSSTRNRFLNIVNPYLEQVQANSGLTAFRVVMDDSNNTPDVVDRNQLVGQIFIQPTRTAEFIVLDFVVQPTGAAFPE
ncbi:phage tail sheath subtilisin-like domain-containing protein [bacterium]|nr:phage tail sheath subtilisin-like domain-containing protein [bacterium]